MGAGANKETEMNFTIGWPQLFWCVFVIVTVVHEITMHGKPKKGEHDAVMYVLVTLISAALLYWGGFFG